MNLKSKRRTRELFDECFLHELDLEHQLITIKLEISYPVLFWAILVVVLRNAISLFKEILPSSSSHNLEKQK